MSVSIICRPVLRRTFNNPSLLFGGSPQFSQFCPASSTAFRQNLKSVQSASSQYQSLDLQNAVKSNNIPSTCVCLFPSKRIETNPVDMLVTSIQKQLNDLRLIRSQASQKTDVINESSNREFSILNRNARKGKRANKGKRPCSRHRRRAGRRSWSNPRR